MTVAIETDARAVLRGSKVAAWQARATLGVRDADVEDVAQEIALRVVVAHRRGYKCGRRAYRMFARDAVRALYGDERASDGRRLFREEPLDQDFVAPGLQLDVRVLCFNRLKEVWPTLTDRQRVGLSCWITGESMTEAAARIGTSMQTLSNSVGGALRRLVDPSKYTRVASRKLFRPLHGGGCVALEAT